jgi:hypothetical protein
MACSDCIQKLLKNVVAGGTEINALVKEYFCPNQLK